MKMLLPGSEWDFSFACPGQRVMEESQFTLLPLLLGSSLWLLIKCKIH